jgi:redox-regulated HSP33 family molecular chaperone
MADEYTAAIKAQLPCETDMADFDMPIIDLPFWSELDRLWDLYIGVREEIDDCKRKANDVQPAILLIHLSLDKLLSKLEMERGFMGYDPRRVACSCRCSCV